MPDFSLFIIPLASDSEGIEFAPLVLCLAGFIYYFWIFAKYRNTDKRHTHEKETTTTVQSMQQLDQFVEHRTRLKNSSMIGSNDSQVEGTLLQNNGLPDIIKSVGGSVGMFDNK